MKMKCADVMFAKFMARFFPICVDSVVQLLLHFAQLAPHHPHVDHEGEPDERVCGDHERRRRQLFAGRNLGHRLEFGLPRLREDRGVHQQQDGEKDPFHSSLSR